MLYCVQAQIVRTDREGWSTSHSIPTFYLDDSVQDITGIEHATQIARDIINPFKNEDWTVYPNVTKCD